MSQFVARKRPATSSPGSHRTAPGTQVLLLCPQCNHAGPLPRWRRDELKVQDAAYRDFTVRCGGCGAALAVHLPPGRRRLPGPYKTPPRFVPVGQRPAILLPPHHPERLPSKLGKSVLAQPRHPYLRSKWLAGSGVRGAQCHLRGFPVRPVAEQAAFLSRLGLDLVESVQGAIVSEGLYVFSLRPETRVLEMLLASLVSAFLPSDWRPFPPDYAFVDKHSKHGNRRNSRVTFAAWRQWLAWARVVPLTRLTPAVRLRLAHKYRAMARVLEPVRPMLLAMCRPIKADQYLLPGDALPSNRTEALGLYAWQTCNGFTRLDYTEQYEQCRGGGFMLTWM